MGAPYMNGGERGIRTPGTPFRAYIRLAGEPIRPLWQLSAPNISNLCFFLAEGAGFEPANLSVNGFQDRRLRPLGHPSGMSSKGYPIHPFKENAVRSCEGRSGISAGCNGSLTYGLILSSPRM